MHDTEIEPVSVLGPVYRPKLSFVLTACRCSPRGADLMLTADAADSMAVELLIAVNPDEDSRLPYLLRVPLASGDLVFRTPGT